MALSTDQALAGGNGYPVQMMKYISPKGSIFTKLPGSTLKLHRPTTTLTYFSLLNLYAADPTISGNSLTVKFYTDATGRTAAGSMTATFPSAATNSYATYPSSVNRAFNVTEGNLPVSGNMKVTFTDAQGDNTLTGKLTLSKNDIVANFESVPGRWKHCDRQPFPS